LCVCVCVCVCMGMGLFLSSDLSNYLPGLASNYDPPDLCLLSSWDYRRESWRPPILHGF
jgi:hypothetical protein